jgi:hypothetical protein
MNSDIEALVSSDDTTLSRIGGVACDRGGSVSAERRVAVQGLRVQEQVLGVEVSAGTLYEKFAVIDMTAL